jgi:23S rRNA (guanosine2251-2'-O)-methyltransferase
MSRSDFICGIHAVRHVLEHAPQNVLEVWLRRDAQSSVLRQIERLLEQHGLRPQRVPAKTLEQIAGGARHQGVVLRIRASTPDLDPAQRVAESGPRALFLILDGVQDPHNLGACLRSAAAAGAHAVIVPKDRAAGMTETVRKVASGGAEHVPLLRVTNLARCLRQLRDAGLLLVGTSPDAPAALYEIDLTGPLGLVLGAEGHGLRRLTRENCDVLARIPMPGPMESLNISVTAGICLFEAVRQRQYVARD